MVITPPPQNCLQRQWFDLRDILNPGTQWEESDFEEVPLKLSNIFGVGDNPRLVFVMID